MKLKCDKCGKELLTSSIISDTLSVKPCECFLIKEKSHLLFAVEAAYRKHHMGDDSIGWDELSDILYDALCLELGDDGFLRKLRTWGIN